MPVLTVDKPHDVFMHIEAIHSLCEHTREKKLHILSVYIGKFVFDCPTQSHSVAEAGMLNQQQQKIDVDKKLSRSIKKIWCTTFWVCFAIALLAIHILSSHAIGKHWKTKRYKKTYESCYLYLCALKTSANPDERWFVR